MTSSSPECSKAGRFSARCNPTTSLTWPRQRFFVLLHSPKCSTTVRAALLAHRLRSQIQHNRQAKPISGLISARTCCQYDLPLLDATRSKHSSAS
eukprot:315623-Chlamydomonas_euryale.AAC.1